ncbi:PilZ domain-containing protein [Desulfonema limicola]|uniref:PilZ domain-containing protein n=1 Tax=Desulfonema limicola TaxID=45656 RepID=A0A975B904_9BACT|nr:PilZ domain-containing protein [Desulfonema limicola]QTA80948.1 PilZ domain-containing protein [Desulfonema limicola]
MNLIPQRAFSRNNFSAPILFIEAENTGHEFHKAKMINCSSGGMFFVSDKKLNPGENIHIKLTDIPSDPYLSDFDDQYFAEVRWCQKNGKNGTASYEVGVRFIQESCRQCGEKILNNYSNDWGLCQDCHNRIDSLSDDGIRHCISNYLLGNIL